MHFFKTGRAKQFQKVAPRDFNNPSFQKVRTDIVHRMNLPALRRAKLL